MRSWLRSLAALVDGQDLVLTAGILLLAYGVRQVYAPAGWIVPGVVLIWMALPTRPFPVVFVRDAKKQE